MSLFLAANVGGATDEQLQLISKSIQQAFYFHMESFDPAFLRRIHHTLQHEARKRTIAE